MIVLRWNSLLLLIALALQLEVAPAQGVVIYRCTDAAGALTIQNDVPCPKGSKQEKRVVQPAQTVAAPPLPVTAPAVPVVVTPPPPIPSSMPAPAPVPDLPPPPPIADADRLPPPPLYQCNTYDKDSYLSETIVETPRCIPLETKGIDGSDALGAGAACQMVTDQCQRVADAAACESWRKYLKEIEASWRFGRAEEKEGHQADFRRVSEMLRDSTCRM